jgi:long-chain fatty acid transport protein
MVRFIVSVAGLCVSSTALMAGGMERTALSTGFMYENGGYAEVSYSSRDYTVTASTFAPDESVIEDQTGFSLAAKFDVTEALSFGLSQYNQAGVGLNYQGAGGTGAVGAVLNSVGPKVSLDIDALVFLGRYALNENYSFMLGMKNSTIKDATADIFKTAGATTAASITGKTASSSVVAIAYEQPDIALRVEYLYEADVSFSLDTTGGLNAGTGTTQGSLPDYQTINFQTGIAADTLAFGSIRMADWKNHQLAVAPQTLAGTGVFGGPTSSFSNSTTYSLGVGRKVSDDLSLSLSTNWENGTESSGTSLLSPTNGYNGYSLGAKYNMDNLTLSGGVNYTTFGDKTITSTIADEFSGNSVLSYGIKLGVNF